MRNNQTIVYAILVGGDEPITLFSKKENTTTSQNMRYKDYCNIIHDAIKNDQKWFKIEDHFFRFDIYSQIWVAKEQ